MGIHTSSLRRPLRRHGLALRRKGRRLSVRHDDLSCDPRLHPTASTSPYRACNVYVAPRSSLHDRTQPPENEICDPQGTQGRGAMSSHCPTTVQTSARYAHRSRRSPTRVSPSTPCPVTARPNVDHPPLCTARRPAAGARPLSVHLPAQLLPSGLLPPFPALPRIPG